MKQRQTVSYMVKRIPVSVYKPAKARATQDGRSMRWVILEALRLYGLRRWSPDGQ